MLSPLPAWPPPVRIRAMRPGDAIAVRRLERVCFGRNAGPPALLRAFLADPSCAGLVAETPPPDRQVVGYLLYHLDSLAREARVCHFAVHPGHRRRGIGSNLLRWLTQRTPPATGIGIRTGVNEGNLAAQLFLRSNRFRAVEILPRAACAGAEDLYLFQFDPGPARE
jgi:ribosomal protein S18 acetylase RimI-like enzyme